MHPILFRRSRVLWFLALCVLVGVLLAYACWRIQPMPFAAAALYAIPLSMLLGVVSLAAWWVCRSAPLGATPAWKIIWKTIAGALESSAVMIGAGTGWAVFVSSNFGLELTSGDLLSTIPLWLIPTVPLYLASMGAHYLWLAIESSRESERRALAAQVAAREAEVRALRAQLNPHFLFNSLNSINSLIGSAPEDARRMCESLGDFLRRTLALGSREAVPLGDELALIERYLEIEHVRFGDRLRLERFSDAAAERCLVPPLLLQPLVENAIKHGVADRIEGGRVRVEARREGDMLRVTVENDRDPDAPPRRGTGVGLENVRQRLGVFSGRHARLDVSSNGSTFRVTLAVPAREVMETRHANP
ncbi:MAG: histidine kinase [Candidatus Eisenbacteria bacterium]|uniref:Histidine kinase n=1 Tax=Eiseniibacteriota bacterium TaxID=2212470 RepID=A0A849SMA1_UNCEI|nr:histidine kinase [Candidatus Eisenbacteria bacterium]